MNIEKLSIIHVNLASAFGGGERQTINLLKNLRAKGVEQFLVTRRSSPLNRYALKETPGLCCLRPLSLCIHLMVKRPERTVLHAHDGHGLHLCACMNVLFNVPYVVTRRVEKAVPKKKISRLSYLRAGKLVAVSSQIKNLINGDLGVEGSIRIPDSFSGFARDGRRIAEIKELFSGKKLIGQIGSLYDIKGHEYTIKAARSLAVERPELHFVILGEGDTRSHLEKMAEGLDNVTFVGFVEDVGNWLAALDLLVHPSLREGLGSILLEAQQFGVPVIASDVGGIPDVVIDGETGLLVPPRDVRALKDAILSLVDDQELSAQLVAGAKAHLVNFTPDAVGQAYLDLYQELLAES